MKIHSETNRKLDKIQNLINNKGYTIAVALALIFVSSLFIGYYLISRLPPEGYTTIYMLNYPEKKASDYPELLIINENNTFNVWIAVENHMGTKQSCEVLQKVIADTIPSFPVEANVKSRYARAIENGETWETLATVSINEVGNYYVIFELWIYDDMAEELQFSYNYCVLPIEVADQL
ncbi:MAG: DUF1616 domain-containing protein [Candidatus Bathyarchaeota archaeon]|nr:MAG: DUF1616 domain-containing protein [Candidatus Bathyarchaeota archaeon]